MGRYNQCFFFSQKCFYFHSREALRRKERTSRSLQSHFINASIFGTANTTTRALGLGKEDYATSNEDWIDASENLVFLW